jgi:hypothetical protein
MGTMWVLAGLAATVSGAQISPGCPAGPALLEDMLQSDSMPLKDEYAELWRRAVVCGGRSIADTAGNVALTQFQDIARDNGLAGGLRTFARVSDFRLVLEGVHAMDMGEADQYLKRSAWAGTWRESSRGSSADGTLLYAVGEVALAKGRTYEYGQVWQFDAKVANWGIRLLMLRPLEKK